MKRLVTQGFVDCAIVLSLMLGDLGLRFPEYVRRISYLRYVSGWIKVCGVYGLVLLATSLLLYALRKIPKIGDGLALIVITFALASNLVFFGVTGDFWGSPFVQILFTSDLHAVYGAFSTYCSPRTVAFLLLACCCAAGIGLIYRTRRKTAASERAMLALALLVAAIGANYSLWNYLYLKLHEFPVEPVSNTIRAAMFTVKEYRDFYSIPREQVPQPVGEAFPTHHVVLILDESVRYDYLSNNHPERTTTPFLRQLEGHPNFYNLGLTISASTCSFNTKSLLLTGTTRVPDLDGHTQRHPTLFQYARASGYETTIVDAPGCNFPNIVIRERDIQEVDQLLRPDDLPGDSPFVDLRGIKALHRLLAKERGQFIVFVKKGAHFHYETSYPREESRFSRHLPRLELNESYASSKEKMRNSYQNALSFTVDEFAKHLFDRDLHNLTIIWTSDHGQSLQEQGQTYTHCKSEIEQAIVPLFLYSDHPWARNLPPSLGKPGGIITSHHHIYPTIVSLMSGNKDFENHGYHSIFSPLLQQRELSYLYGGIWTQSRIMTTSPDALSKFLSIPSP